MSVSPSGHARAYGYGGEVRVEIDGVGTSTRSPINSPTSYVPDALTWQALGDIRSRELTGALQMEQQQSLHLLRENRLLRRLILERFGERDASYLYQLIKTDVQQEQQWYMAASAADTIGFDGAGFGPRSGGRSPRSITVETRRRDGSSTVHVDTSGGLYAAGGDGFQPSVGRTHASHSVLDRIAGIVESALHGPKDTPGSAPSMALAKQMVEMDAEINSLFERNRQTAQTIQQLTTERDIAIRRHNELLAQSQQLQAEVNTLLALQGTPGEQYGVDMSDPWIGGARMVDPLGRGDLGAQAGAFEDTPTKDLILQMLSALTANAEPPTLDRLTRDPTEVRRLLQDASNVLRTVHGRVVTLEAELTVAQKCMAQVDGLMSRAEEAERYKNEIQELRNQMAELHNKNAKAKASDDESMASQIRHLKSMCESLQQELAQAAKYKPQVEALEAEVMALHRCKQDAASLRAEISSLLSDRKVGDAAAGVVPELKRRNAELEEQLAELRVEKRKWGTTVETSSVMGQSTNKSAGRGQVVDSTTADTLRRSTMQCEQLTSQILSYRQQEMYHLVQMELQTRQQLECKALATLFEIMSNCFYPTLFILYRQHLANDVRQLMSDCESMKRDAKVGLLLQEERSSIMTTREQHERSAKYDIDIETLKKENHQLRLHNQVLHRMCEEFRRQLETAAHESTVKLEVLHSDVHERLVEAQRQFEDKCEELDVARKDLADLRRESTRLRDAVEQLRHANRQNTMMSYAEATQTDASSDRLVLDESPRVQKLASALEASQAEVMELKRAKDLFGTVARVQELETSVAAKERIIEALTRQPPDPSAASPEARQGSMETDRSTAEGTRRMVRVDIDKAKRFSMLTPTPTISPRTDEQDSRDYLIRGAAEVPEFGVFHAITPSNAFESALELQIRLFLTEELLMRALLEYSALNYFLSRCGPSSSDWALAASN